MRGLLRAFFWLLGALALVVVAWGLSNRHDEAPQPLAPELQRSAILLAPEQNAYFGLIGLWSLDPAYHGQGRAHWEALRRWKLEYPWRARPQGVKPPEITREIQGPEARSNHFPACDRFPCLAKWDETPSVVLKAVAARSPVLMERCEQLAGMRFEEDPGEPDIDAPFLGIDGFQECTRLWHAQSLIEWRTARPAEAVRHLQLAHRLAVVVMQGSRSLIMQVLAARSLKMSYDWAAHMVAERPAWAGRLASIAQPLPPAALDLRHALRVELAFSRMGIEAIRDGCHSGLAQRQTQAAQIVGEVLCDGVMPMAFHVEQTRNERQPVWRAAFEALAQPAPAGLNWMRAHPEPKKTWWQRIAWRNTGMRLLDAEVTPSTYGNYLGRVYDTELHRLALAAVLEAASSDRLLSAILEEKNRSPYAGGRLWWDSRERKLAMTLWESADNSREARMPTSR